MTTKLSNDLLIDNPSYRNRLINSSFAVNQRNAGASAMGSSIQYLVDGWHTYQFASPSVVNASIGSTLGTQAPNQKSYVVFTTATADTYSSTEVGYFSQIIEGYRLEDLQWGTANAKNLTLSFWARSGTAGLVCSGAVQNMASTRSYTFNYTITAANTWEFKTVVIAGDTANALAQGTNQSLRVFFATGAGSSFLTASGGWNAGTFVGVTGATGIVGTFGRVLYLAGIQLEIGGSSSPFEYKSYDQDLLDCQRYYFRQQATATSQSFFLPLNIVSTTVATGLVRFPASMRIAPTALEQSGTAGNYAINTTGTLTTCSAVPTFGTATTVGSTITLTAASGLTAGQAGHVSSSAASGSSAYFGWSAEFI